MRVIDFHNHYYPPAYLDALRSGSSTVKVTIDADGNPCLHYPGDYNVAVPGHRDIDYREQVLKDHRVDTQVITLTTPGTHVETPDAAVRLSRLVNDAFADVVASKKGRFTSLATLPLNDPRASASRWPISASGRCTKPPTTRKPSCTSIPPIPSMWTPCRNTG
jgi:aminocarboxymuconate-semialdehyde decarboxylase